jgi:diguanylate cyclase (GGDEF)-like protein
MQFGAILFLDLDKFKVLNDSYGHEYGDMLLIQVADRIKSALRDIDTVARLGGDEFIVILESLGQNEEDAIKNAKQLAETIRLEITKKFQLNDCEYLCSASIGVSMFRGDNNYVSELLKHADIAMYSAKNSGRNSVRFYEQLASEQ